MKLRFTPLVVQWTNGTYSIHLGTGSSQLLEMLDELGDPGDAEVRVIPSKFAGYLILNQKESGGSFAIEPCEHFFSIDQLWAACTKVVWPSSSGPDCDWLSTQD
jgi:hypothetical protein